MTVAESHLSGYGVSMQAANAFIMSNLSNLKTVFDTCKQFGVNNDMIATIYGQGVTGNQVESYFTSNGFKGAELGHDFALTSTWLSGKTIYDMYGPDSGYTPGIRTLRNDVDKMTFNADGTGTMGSGTTGSGNPMRWSVDDRNTLKLDGGTFSWYMRASGEKVAGSDAYVVYSANNYSSFSTNDWFTPEVITTDLSVIPGLIGVSIPANNVFKPWGLAMSW